MAAIMNVGDIHSSKLETIESVETVTINFGNRSIGSGDGMT